jgi:hypothetical protein
MLHRAKAIATYVMNIVKIREELRRLISIGEIVPIVGAGVSMATCETPGWKALLTNGLVHLQDRGLISDAVESKIKAALDTNNLTKAAGLLQHEMGAPGGEYAAWLETEFDDTQRTIISSSLISQILDLPSPLIATTNYDRLLERFDVRQRRPAIQTRPDELLGALRLGGILHLHGIYTDPKSVVLSKSDYDAALKNNAYRKAIETIWLTRGMLFIGCSFDGISDRDFTGLFNWAYKTFGPSPRRHYALVAKSLATAANQRLFLLGHQHLQLVPFGTDRAKLPEFVRSLNPMATEAHRRRIQRAMELIGSSGDVKVSEYADLIRPLISSVRIADFEAQASEALAERVRGAERNRTQIRLVQMLFRNIAEEREIVEVAEKWNEGHQTYDENVHRICLAAMNALAVCPPELLKQLDLRGFPIPATVRNGMSQQEVRLLDLARRSPALKELRNPDTYGRELLHRLLRAFVTIVAVDAEKVFPLPVGGVRISLDGQFIAVGSSRGVELIDIDHDTLAAALETDGEVLDLLEVQYIQSSALLILLFDRLLIWDPRRAGSPLVQIELNTTEGARLIVADRAHRGTAFHICFHEHELQRFDNFEPRERLYLNASMSAFEVFDGRIFAISGQAEVFEFDLGGRISMLATREHLIDYVASLRTEVPFVAKLGTNRCAFDVGFPLGYSIHFFGK